MPAGAAFRPARTARRDGYDALDAPRAPRAGGDLAPRRAPRLFRRARAPPERRRRARDHRGRGRGAVLILVHLDGFRVQQRHEPSGSSAEGPP